LGSGSCVSRNRRSAYRNSLAESLRSAVVSVCPFDGKLCSFDQRLCELVTEGVTSWWCARCPAGNINWKDESG